MIPEPAPGSRYADRFELRQATVHAPAYVEYRALDAEIGVEVGLWWLRPGLIGGAAGLERLLGAAVELRRVAHPHLRKLHGAGRADAGPWVSWQLASGAGPAPVRGQALPLPSVVRWVDAVCGALDALHAVGIVCGRLVPEDVVDVGGVLRLGGGGVLGAVEPGAAQRAWTRWLGYVAPEVRAGAAPTAAADAWAVAAIAAAMVGGSDGADDAMRVVARRHPPLGDLFGEVLAAPAEARPVELAGFAAAVRERAAMPYLADDRTGPMRVLAASAASAARKPARPRGQPRRVAAPDEPTAIGPPSGVAAGGDVGPPAPAPAPVDFALPTPAVAPPPPRPAPPAVAITRPDPRAVPPAAPAPAAPAPVAVADPAPRRAPFSGGAGGIRAVSMKPRADPAPAAGGGAAAAADDDRKKVRLRNISEAGQRKFSVAPGALGYLAPPRQAAAEAHERLVRRRRLQMVLVGLVLVAAAIGGYLAAVNL